jgi:hypothetical protein
VVRVVSSIRIRSSSLSLLIKVTCRTIAELAGFRYATWWSIATALNEYSKFDSATWSRKLNDYNFLVVSSSTRQGNACFQRFLLFQLLPSVAKRSSYFDCPFWYLTVNSSAILFNKIITVSHFTEHSPSIIWFIIGHGTGLNSQTVKVCPTSCNEAVVQYNTQK